MARRKQMFSICQGRHFWQLCGAYPISPASGKTLRADKESIAPMFTIHLHDSSRSIADCVNSLKSTIVHSGGTVIISSGLSGKEYD